MRSRRWLFGLAVVLGMLGSVGLFASSAMATIVVGQSIAGARLGVGQSTIRGVLGAPDYTQKATKRNGPVWGYSKGPLMGRISFDRKTLLSGYVWTGSEKQKTSKKVGPGSLLAATKAAYPAASCSTGPFGPNSLICQVKGQYRGRHVCTDFVFFTSKSPMREVDVYYG